MPGRRSSATFLPLRSRMTGSSVAVRMVSTGAMSASGDVPGTSMTHVHEVTASWREVSERSMTTTASTSTPGGSSGVSRSGSASRSTSAPSGSVRSTSRYSPSDSWPVDSASPKCIFGRGEKPSVLAIGSSARRRARSQQRARSRWLVKRTLPSLR